MSIPGAIKRYLAIMKSPQQPKAIADAIKRGVLLTESKTFTRQFSHSAYGVTHPKHGDPFD